MHSLRRLLAAVLALSAPLALGCRDPVSPDAMRGTFVLRTFTDSTLPFVQERNATYLIRRLADTLTFDGRGYAAWIWLVRYEFPSRPAHLVRDVGEYDYRLSGSAVEFTYRCPPLAMCVRSRATGRLTADGRLQLPNLPQAPIYTFVRVR